MYRLGNGGPDLLRILAACALGRDNLERIDYIVIERALLADLGAEFDASAEGKTPDATVNKVHEDVVVITAVKLIDLVHGTWESEKLDRCEKKDLVDGGVSGFQNGFWTPDRVKSPKMKDSLRRILPDLKL